MNENGKNWPVDTDTGPWDPHEVWRQRILLPRIQEQARAAADRRNWHEHAIEAGQSIGPGNSPEGS